MCPNQKTDCGALNGDDGRGFSNRMTPPFSCIFNLQYYDDRNLLKRPDLGLF